MTNTYWNRSDSRLPAPQYPKNEWGWRKNKGASLFLETGGAASMAARYLEKMRVMSIYVLPLMGRELVELVETGFTLSGSFGIF